MNSAYPLIALYTSAFPSSGLSALSARGIPHILVPTLAPKAGKTYVEDARFNDCWTKLVPFSLTQFTRIVQLDSDMLVLRNMDELMDLALDDTSRLFAAGHACVCNPLKRAHYPANWVPGNCALTMQHHDPDAAQTTAVDPARSLGSLNSGLLVIQPSQTHFDEIVAHMDVHADEYSFPDQDLLADLYRGRWVPLPYIYNALKTLRSAGVHDKIWRDESVKNVHYILTPKPWDELDDNGEWKGTDETHSWWAKANKKRVEEDKASGLAV